MPSSDYSPVGLATAIPSSLHRSLVMLLACFLVLLTMVLWQRAGDAGPALPMFVGIYQTTVVICDLLTALMLFSQFSQFRTANLLLLSCGYLFTSIIVAIHLGSFPGVFAAEGVLGGDADTAPWLWTIWHLVFPATVLLYAVARRPITASPRLASTVAVVLTVGAVAAAYIFSTRYNDLLPAMIVERTFTPFFLGILYPAMMGLCIVALAALLFRPAQHPIITMYLLLAVLAFLLDVVNNWHSGARYAVGWYVGRANSLVASAALCIVFIIENTVLLRHANRAAAGQKLAKAQLRRERDFAEGLLNTAPAIVLVLDSQGRIVRFNPYFELLSGVALNDVQGKDWFTEFLPADIADSSRAAFRNTAHVIPTSGLVNPIVTRNGKKRLIEWYNQALVQDADNAVGVLAIGIDVTERKALDDALRIAKTEAERANNAKSRFLAAASHDLRQPLTALALYVSAVGIKLPASDQKLVTNMNRCVSHLSEMLSGLLDLSKLDAGVVTPQISDFALEEILSKTISSHAPEAKAKGLTLRHRHSGLIGHTDPMLFQRIIGNLVSNAIRYAEHGGVLIGCRRRQGRMWVEVWDSGIGIPADKTDDIFEEFKQLGNTERNQAKGSGLGLAIVAKSAALLGLKIRVQSKPGKGSLFAVELPLGHALPPVVKDLYLHRPLRIALVEDNADVAAALDLALTSIGHQVEWAPAFAELLPLLGNVAPDILITDYRLAGEETGFDVIDSLRAAFDERLPAIVITGDTDPAVIRRMAEQGICVQHKPLDVRVLRERIAELTQAAGRAALHSRP